MLSKNVVVKFPSFEQQSFFWTYRVTFGTMVISVGWIIGPLKLFYFSVSLTDEMDLCDFFILIVHVVPGFFSTWQILMILQCNTLQIINFGFVILFSLAKNFEESYIESGGTSSSFCNKVFASWDYCISDENTAKVKSQNIVQTVRVSVCKINMNEGVRC